MTMTDEISTERLIQALEYGEIEYSLSVRDRLVALTAERDAARARSAEDEATTIAALQRNLDLKVAADAALAEVGRLRERVDTEESAWHGCATALVKVIIALKHPRSGSERAAEADTPASPVRDSAEPEKGKTKAVWKTHTYGGGTIETRGGTVPYGPFTAQPKPLATDRLPTYAERLADIGRRIANGQTVTEFEAGEYRARFPKPLATDLWPNCEHCHQPLIPAAYVQTGVHRAAHVECADREAAHRPVDGEDDLQAAVAAMTLPEFEAFLLRIKDENGRLVNSREAGL